MNRNKGAGRHRSFPKAWWHLSPGCRDMLEAERKSGMYNSGAPAAPYWLIAEHGSASQYSSVDTGVPARYYLQNSRMSVDMGVPMITAKVDV